MSWPAGASCEAGFTCSFSFHFTGPNAGDCGCVDGQLECCGTLGLMVGGFCSYADGKKPPCPMEPPQDGAPCGPGPNACNYPFLPATFSAAEAHCDGKHWAIKNIQFVHGYPCPASAPHLSQPPDGGAPDGGTSCYCDVSGGGAFTNCPGQPCAADYHAGRKSGAECSDFAVGLRCSPEPGIAQPCRCQPPADGGVSPVWTCGPGA